MLKYMSNIRNLTLMSVVLIVIAGCCVYANSIHGKFIWDDKSLIRDNIYIRSWSNSENIFTKNILAGSSQGSTFYRPIQIITYINDYSSWKMDVRGYHFTNIILHIFATLAIFWFIITLFGSIPLALITALLFVTHPIHTEAVSYLSGRADPLAALFLVLSLTFYLKNLRSPCHLTSIFMAACYGLALLSKESSVIFLILILLYHYIFRERIRAKELLPVLILTALYIYLRLFVLKSLSHEAQSFGTIPARLPGIFVAITNYIRLLFLPFNLHMEYGTKLFSPTNAKAATGALILLSSISYAVTRKGRNIPAVFGILWFFTALVPVSNIYPLNAYMAEHWLYLPSIGFFLVLANIVVTTYNSKLRYIVALATVFAISLYSYLTIKQNQYWREPIAFYERTLKYEPDSWRSYNSLGGEYYEAGDRNKAILLYLKAMEVNPDDANVYNNIGLVYSDNGAYEDAIAAYEKALRKDPNYSDAYSNLGIAYYGAGKTDDALASFEKALQINPYNNAAHNNLGVAYQLAGKHREAIGSFERAVRSDPNNPQSYLNLSIEYYNIGQYVQAVDYYDRAVLLGQKGDPEYVKLIEQRRER